MTDKRYTIELEWCGYARRRWVVRFCGNWVGQNARKAAALNRVANICQGRISN